MQPKYAIAVAALMLVPASILYAAEVKNAPEAKVPPAVKHEPVMVTYMGVWAIPAGAALEQQLGLPRGVGLIVKKVVPDSPAAKAGLKRFDVLQKVDDQLLTNIRQLRVLVRMHQPGDTVKISYIRNGKPDIATLTLGSTQLKMDGKAYRHGMGYRCEPGYLRHYRGMMIGLEKFFHGKDRCLQGPRGHECRGMMYGNCTPCPKPNVAETRPAPVP